MSNVQSVTLVAGQTATLQWVVAQTGLLHIVITGLNGTLGGFLDLVGPMTLRVDIPASGDVTVELLAGTYQATFTPPPGYMVV